MNLTGARTVTDPGGTEWTVRPRWRVGPDFRLRRRRRDDDGSRLDFFGEMGDFVDADDGVLPVIITVIVFFVVIVLTVFVFWPLIAFALELLIAVILLAAGVVARFVLRRPWIVEASTATGASRVRYSVRGYRAMRRVSAEVADRIAAGEHTPIISGAERV